VERGLHRRGVPTNLKRGSKKAAVRHKTATSPPLSESQGRRRRAKLGEALAAQLQREKAIMGVFDEGCMGMFNAIIPDELLNPTGVYKERLSQSALYYETTQVSDDEARAVRQLDGRRGHEVRHRPGPRRPT
jgi:hypothetical protein